MRLRPVLTVRALRHEHAVRTIGTHEVAVAVHERLRFRLRVREDSFDEQVRGTLNDAVFEIHGEPSVVAVDRKPCVVPAQTVTLTLLSLSLYSIYYSGCRL